MATTPITLSARGIIMVKIKGNISPLEGMILKGIKNPMAQNIKFTNVTFDCQTIEDASGHLFIRVENKNQPKEESE